MMKQQTWTKQSREANRAAFVAVLSNETNFEMTTLNTRWRPAEFLFRVDITFNGFETRRRVIMAAVFARLNRLGIDRFTIRTTASAITVTF